MKLLTWDRAQTKSYLLYIQNENVLETNLISITNISLYRSMKKSKNSQKFVAGFWNSIIILSEFNGLVIVANAGDVKPDKLHGISKTVEVPYSRSKHEDIV